MRSEKWSLGVFASVDAGLGVPLSMAAELGVPTIHLHAPRRESRTAERRAVLEDELCGFGLEVSCLFAGFEGESYADISSVRHTVGLVPHATRAERVVELKAIANFARELGVAAVGLHLGFVPPSSDFAEYERVISTTRMLCDYCASQGQTLHLETGQESPDALAQFLSDADRPNLAVNFDPANMILYGAGEPLPALSILGPHVRSIHCKDAVASEKPGETWGREVPLGEGDVGIPAFLSLLAHIGYDGPLIIEREVGGTPEERLADLRAAVHVLERARAEVLGASR
jgi:sugar phosphate isomerase/epimerase